VPVALDCLEAPEPFTFRGRKTGNERRALTPNVDEMSCKPDHETSSKTDGGLRSRQHNDEVQFYAFDVLSTDGDDLRKLPLSMRKASLAWLNSRALISSQLNQFGLDKYV
jgi:hypothetical protein